MSGDTLLDAIYAAPADLAARAGDVLVENGVMLEDAGAAGIEDEFALRAEPPLSP